MACGTPVIGSNVGGIKHTVVDGVTGYLVPPRDPEALAERIALLLRHRRLLRQFARRSVARAYQAFTWERIASQIADVYEAVAPPDGVPVAAGRLGMAAGNRAVGERSAGSSR
jgi:D-inositol-3-phosphate glycosyltransferase